MKPASDDELNRWVNIAIHVAILVVVAAMLARQSLILASLAAHDARSASAIQAIEEWQRAHSEHTDVEITRQVKPEALK